jgi:hypothetical protein
MKKRMGYLKLHEEVTLDKVGLTVWAYSKRGKYLGRVEINHAGIAAYIGVKGRKRLGNLSWEQFFDRLAKKRNKRAFRSCSPRT